MYIKAFLFCGLVCLIGQIILDNSKLTPGHLNTIFVIIGCVLAGLGIYDKFISFAGAGATVPITNFGALLVTPAVEGYKMSGFTGLIKNLLTGSSAGLSITIVISFIVAVLFKPKN